MQDENGRTVYRTGIQILRDRARDQSEGSNHAAGRLNHLGKSDIRAMYVLVNLYLLSMSFDGTTRYLDPH